MTSSKTESQQNSRATGFLPPLMGLSGIFMGVSAVAFLLTAIEMAMRGGEASGYYGLLSLLCMIGTISLLKGASAYYPSA